MSQQTDDQQASDSELKTGVYKVQVWPITGENTDKSDLLAGGSSILGPYTWVVESHKDAFVAEMERRYGNDFRVRSIYVQKRAFVETDKVPTLEEELQVFEDFLANPASWRT